MCKMTSCQEDEGFEALLKPIQDLTRNWEEDLSLHLEEYIKYIHQICGDKIPDMNFAQAAVLVQNSANIYSKKVDFLFTTVLQLLETISKKQNEAKNRESQEDDIGQQAGKRRKPVAVLETEEFVLLDEVCSDRPLTVCLEKEKQKIVGKKKPKIVLNAATKVKAKEKTSCNVYHCGQDIMGKKDEFRLNWKMCSAGTLHEEFIINKNRFKSMEPVEISVIPEIIAALDDSNHDYDAYSPSPDNVIEGIAPLATSLFSIVTIDRESEVRGDPQLRNPLREEDKKNTVDIKEIEWQPNDFNANLTEKPVKKKKVVKIPLGLEDEKKRKLFQENLITSFTISEVLFGQYKSCNFTRDGDFCYQSKFAVKHKRQLLLEHRAKYQAYLEKEAGIDQITDFNGFYNEEHDSDNEHNFPGFEGKNEAPEEDVPLPDKQSILDHYTDDQCWRGDDDDNNEDYNNEAKKTMQAFHCKRIDHEARSEMAKRVEDWHQRVLPKLAAEEKRSSFDIHVYGSKILDAFSGEIGCEKTFAEIVAGQPREEVARYFLSTLLLANQYNIEISKSDPGDLVSDCVVLKLLSVIRHHEELDDNMRQTSDK